MVRKAMGEKGATRRRAKVLLALVTLFAIVLGALPARALDVRAFRIAGDSTRVRLIVGFDQDPSARFLLLRSPHRLVIDLPETRFLLKPKDVRGRGLVRDVRYGNTGTSGSRFVIQAKGPFQVDRFDVVTEDDGTGQRLIVEISTTSERAFESALADQALTTASTAAAKGPRIGPSVDRPPEKRFTVVVDAGHGGIDGGANGINGTVEKDITLAFAQELRARLAAGGRYDVYMTRYGDEFLRLDDRVRIAREHDADLFISIHADTISAKGIRGATVYTVSDKASDAEAKALADRENLSDKLAGIQVEDENHEVADILVDLIRRETHAFSIGFARTLVGELGQSVGLINNPHRFAGFRVLRAPDVPSVLVELGYLSNDQDEAQLRNPEWRRKAVESIASAVDSFAAKRAPGG